MENKCDGAKTVRTESGSIVSLRFRRVAYADSRVLRINRSRKDKAAALAFAQDATLELFFCGLEQTIQLVFAPDR